MLIRRNNTEARVPINLIVIKSVETMNYFPDNIESCLSEDCMLIQRTESVGISTIR